MKKTSLQKSSFIKHIPASIAALVALCVMAGLAYGPLVATAGVFGDDPNVLYAYHRMGTDGFDAFYGWARPYSTWVYKLVIPLIGINLTRIHLITICLRVISSWMLFLLVRELVDGQTAMAWIAAMTALVFPGFTQQAQSVQFLLHFSVLSLALFSIWAMVKGVRTEKPTWRVFWLAVAIISAVAQISIEYFFGLELVRPVVLGLAIQGGKKRKSSLARFLRFYWPFLALLGVYLTWRVFIFQPAYPRITVLDAMRVQPIATVAALIGRIGTDLVIVLGGAWAEMVRMIFSDPITPVMGLCGVAAGGLAVAGFLPIRRQEPAEKKMNQCLIWIGICAVLLGGVPLWVSGTPLTGTHPWNRTMLCYLAGVSMLSAGVVSLLPRRMMQALVPVIMGMAIVFQHQIAADYTREWLQVKDVFDQFTNQAPQLSEGTLVLYDDLPFHYYSANNLNAFLNWTYDPQRGSGNEKYKLFEIDERLGNALPTLNPGEPIVHNTFKGNTSQVLVIALGADGELVILDKKIPFEGPLPGRTREALHLSDPQGVIKFDRGQAKVPAVLE